MKKYIFGLFWSLYVVCATGQVTISGNIRDKSTKMALPFVNVVLKSLKDSSFVTGTVSNEAGQFMLPNIKSGHYIIACSYVGYQNVYQNILLGKLSPFLDLGDLELIADTQNLQEVVITGKQAVVSGKMEKKIFNVADNISQSGGSVLQAMSTLPSVTVSEGGKVQLRGSDKVTVLIDGKQTALTGFDSQKGLDNLPASAIERIEIINNPSAKYDANGNAGIINIVFKKQENQGFNGKLGFAGGLGAIWRKHENLPTIRPQFQNTPKLNPSLSMNYRKNKINIYAQLDWLYTQTLNKNEFATRVYDNDTSIFQQVKRNRTTTYATVKTGVDYAFDDHNIWSLSGLFNRELIDDRGDIPYFKNDFTNRYRLWQFMEDEVKYTASATANYVHKFKQAGHQLSVNSSYYFHREDEKYFFTNTLPQFVGSDAFKLLSDEHVADLNVDYNRPLRNGRVEMGMKLRRRSIPVNMQFFAGQNSPIDTNAGGWANYYETIPATYATYVFETNRWEFEGGLRLEYVGVNYEVNPNHNTYKNDGYHYVQPFPNLRLAYKWDENNKISLFFNRRVDRPNEVDIRIFPKYDEPELIKVGNPSLKPQFTSSMEVGYKTLFPTHSFYAALYHRITEGTMTRIATQIPNSTILYHVFQNAGRSFNTGIELVAQQNIDKKMVLTWSGNLYRNQINAFSVVNLYPKPTTYTANKQILTSGNMKLNLLWHLPKNYELQMAFIYLAPDLIPQGKVFSRYGMDFGVKKIVQKGKGEWFFNATDVFNTMILKKEIVGTQFRMMTSDYYETQVFRLGYSYKY